MDGGHMHIETGVDRLLNLIQDKPQISVTQAADMLAIERQAIEDWAYVLEGAGLMLVQEGLMDKMLINPNYARSMTGAISSHLKSFFSTVESAREKEIREQRKELGREMKEINMKITQLKRFEDIKTEAEHKLEFVKQKLAELKAAQKKLDADIASMDKKKAFVEGKEKDIAQREELLKIKFREIDSASESLRIHERMLRDEEELLQRQIASLIDTHEQSKSRLMQHLEKTRIENVS